MQEERQKITTNITKIFKIKSRNNMNISMKHALYLQYIRRCGRIETVFYFFVMITTSLCNRTASRAAAYTIGTNKCSC